MWNSEHRLLTESLLVPFRTPGGHRRYNRRMLDEYLEATRLNHKHVQMGVGY